MMNKIICFAAVLVILSAFTAPKNDSFPVRFIHNFVEFIKKRPQEKVYLHTDRDHYEVGDKVWFRAYLTDFIDHREADYSRFVYVELRDRQDSLYARVKISLQDSVYAGFLPLSTELSQGDYFVRAYTYWMQNAGDDYIFRKKIRVINPRDTKVQTEVICEETDKGKYAVIRFFNSRQEAYDKVFVEYTQQGKTKLGRTDENGKLRVKLDTVNYGKKILVRFKEETPFPYEHYLYLPDPNKDFDVTFMPEGGHLLEGCSQTVAFKAIGRDGLSREVSGYLTDENNTPISYLQTVHKGMGAFDLQVQPGKRYYAMLTSADSLQKRFELPIVEKKGIALKASVGTDVLGYMLIAADSAQISEPLYFVAHTRGILLWCRPISPGAKERIFIKDLPEGMLHLLVMNGKGEIYTERLCFIRKQGRPEIELQTDKSVYDVRDLVNLQMQIQTDSMRSLEGTFSVAITDDSKTERDLLQNNILSYLLLTSDLKGHIEEPAFYFKDFTIATRRYLDLLMLTQGWSRFDIQKIVNEDYDSLNYYLERGQAVSGKVKNFWGKEAKEANLILIARTGKIGTFWRVNADSSGRFVLDGIKFPDSTKFILQAKSHKGRRSVEVLIDEEKYLAPTVREPYGGKYSIQEDDFYKRFKKDYYYDNGVKVYVLDEAVVRRKVVPKYFSFFDQAADFNLDSTKLASMGVMNMKDVLGQIPGVYVDDKSVKRFGKELLLLVNEFEEEDLFYIFSFTPQELLSISFIGPPMAMSFWGEKKAKNGAILITTNPNFVHHRMPSLNLVSFSLLGYQQKAEFYVPRYEVDSVRLALADSTDLRTTIYWNPDIRTDAKGKAEFSFTTADGGGPYSVVIEGILSDGTICRKEQKIKLK